MKKRTWKMLALLVSLVLIFGLLWFANGLLGNPISKHFALQAAQKRMHEMYSDTDYVLGEITYSFKDGGYYADVSSPSSKDSDFTMAFNWKGQFRWDSYEDRVVHRENTASRLEKEYQKCVEQVLTSSLFPYPGEIQYGILKLDRREAIKASAATDTLAFEDLELDKVYDVSALGKQYGKLILYVDSDVVTMEQAAEMMLEIRRQMDDAGVGFRVLDFTLEQTVSEDEPRSEIFINSGEFPYEDIYEEGLLERLQAADRAIKEEYAKQEAIKAEEEKAALGLVSE